jgi:hypothetical protein
MRSAFLHSGHMDRPAGVPPWGKKTSSGEPRPYRDEATQREIAAQERTHGRGRFVMHCKPA